MEQLPAGRLSSITIIFAMWMTLISDKQLGGDGEANLAKKSIKPPAKTSNNGSNKISQARSNLLFLFV
jgi:hypothetical protein